MDQLLRLIYGNHFVVEFKDVMLRHMWVFLYNTEAYINYKRENSQRQNVQMI